MRVCGDGLDMVSFLHSWVSPPDTQCNCCPEYSTQLVNPNILHVGIYKLCAILSWVSKCVDPAISVNSNVAVPVGKFGIIVLSGRGSSRASRFTSKENG